MRRRSWIRSVLVSSFLVLTLFAGFDSLRGQTLSARPFTIGISRNDASIAPIVIARDALTKSGFLIRSIDIETEDPRNRLLPLTIGEVDVIYGDGVSVLMGLLGTRGDVMLIGGALPTVTGSVFASPKVFGLDSLTKSGGSPLSAVVAFPVGRSDRLTFEHIALNAILRKKGVEPAKFVTVPTGEWKFEPTFQDLMAGRFDLIYVTAEYVAPARGTFGKLQEIVPPPVTLQGVLIATRLSILSERAREISLLLRQLSDAARRFNESQVDGVKALQTIGLDSAAASYVYATYRKLGAFDLLEPNSKSISNLIVELSFPFPDAKRIEGLIRR